MSPKPQPDFFDVSGQQIGRSALYGLAFLFTPAPKWQGARPLEEHAFNRKSYDSAPRRAPRQALAYLDGARRFDRGERDSFITIPMALAAGLELIRSWGVGEIEARLRMLT